LMQRESGAPLEFIADAGHLPVFEKPGLFFHSLSRILRQSGRRHH
jgi:hypothetical protein